MNDVAAGAHTIGKRFGATTALDGVDFEVLTGEIHALVGENGAGKSTLVRILGGAVRPDEGQVTIAGRERRLTSPHDATVNGITTIPQELHLVPALSIAENLALGDPPLRRLFGLPAFIDRARMRDEARAQLGAFDFVPDPDLPGAAARVRRAADRRHRQGAAAALPRAHSRRADRRAGKSRDHATVQRAGRLEVQGTGIVYVSHRLEEIVALADRCHILRDGRVAAVVRGGALISADLVAAMTGAPAQQTIAGDNARRGVAGRRRPAPGRHRAARRRSVRPCRPARQRDDPSAAAFFRPGAGRRRGLGKGRARRYTAPGPRSSSALGLYRRRAGSVW